MKTLAALTFLLAFTSSALAEKPRADTLGAFVAKAAPGSKKVKSFKGNLEAPRVAIFPIKKGRCYVLVLRLGDGATIERSAVEMDWPDDGGQQQPVGFGAVMTDASGSVFQPDCASTSASVGVWVGLQTFDGIQPHGKGAYTIDVFERVASKRQVAKEAAARAQFQKDSANERTKARAKTCGECSSPISGRKVCLERRGVTMSDCGW